MTFLNSNGLGFFAQKTKQVKYLVLVKHRGRERTPKMFWAITIADLTVDVILDQTSRLNESDRVKHLSYGFRTVFNVQPSYEVNTIYKH